MGEQPVDDQIIEQVREASRHLAREFGFMNATLASTSLHASSLHTLLEIDIHGPQTAADLSYKLNLEKSSISRMLKKLIESGDIREQSCDQDARVKWLHLTEKGKGIVAIAHNYAQNQAQQALALVSPYHQLAIADALALYAAALENNRCDREWTQIDMPVDIIEGYQTGAIGRIAYLMSTYFAEYYNFGRFFESRIATESAEFTGRLHNPRNQLWLAVRGGEVVGSIAIDSEDLQLAGVAHLRWFIMDKSIRGLGVGRRLLDAAVSFCDEQAFDEIHLWTLKGLTAASKLYQDYDFSIAKELVAQQWGEETIEQLLIRKNPNSRQGSPI